MADLPEESIERLSRVTRLLRTEPALPAKLETVATIVKRTVPHCDVAAINMLIDGEPTISAVTDGLAVQMDLVQDHTGEGPYLSAMADSDVVRIDVVERDRRFPRFAPRALAFDINSVLSVPLRTSDRVVGALNLYSHLPGAFGARSQEAVEAIADYAAEVIGASPLYARCLDLVDGLVEPLEDRALIAQAIGVIMARQQTTDADALDRLRRLALARGEAMRTVAERVLKERPTAPSPGRKAS